MDERTNEWLDLTFGCSGVPWCHGHRWRAESEGLVGTPDTGDVLRARGVMFQEHLPPPSLPMRGPALNVFLEAGERLRGAGSTVQL